MSINLRTKMLNSSIKYSFFYFFNTTRFLPSLRKLILMIVRVIFLKYPASYANLDVDLHQYSIFEALKIFYSILIILFTSVVVQAQPYQKHSEYKRTNIWYFGDHAGIDFNGGTPVALTKGALKTDEGCASIADTNGNLLFYTDGITVWNRNHLPMPNGTGLKGDASSTQSALIIPQPGNDSIYFVFTVFTSSNGFRYSKVNMNLNGGLGDVEVNTKNTILLASTTEKLTATYHANGRDIWVVVHGVNNSNYYSYLINNNGLVSSPIISDAGSVNRRGDIGQLKISPNAKKILNCLNASDKAELLDFDNSTGEISNPIILPNIHSPYGCEFSDNSNIIYIAEVRNNPCHIYQFDVSSNIPSTIVNSRTTVVSYNNENFGSLQLGPDNKIYVAALYKSYIGVINNPNDTGLNCNFIVNGLLLGSKISRLGLPNFIHIPEIKYTVIEECQNKATLFLYTGKANYDSLKWDLGNGDFSNTQFSDSFLYNYPLSGNYTTKMIHWENGVSDTITKEIRIAESYEDSQTLEICHGDTLFIGTKFYTVSGNYTDTFQSISGCDSIVFTNLTVHNIDSNIQYFEICRGDSIYIGSNSYYETGIYTNTFTSSWGCDSIIITNLLVRSDTFKQFFESCNGFEIMVGNNLYNSSGTYIDTLISIYGCDSIVITELIIHTPTITTNVYNECEGFSVTVGTNTYTVTGRYKDVVNLCDTIITELTINPNPNFKLLKTDDNCNKGQGNIAIIIVTGTPPYTYNWNTGSSDSVISELKKGIYTASVTDSLGCLSTDSTEVFDFKIDCDSYLYFPDAFSPNGDGLNDVFKVEALNVSYFKLQIFNRWGELVFKSDNPEKGWDGTFNGEQCQTGVYMFMIEYNFDNHLYQKNLTHKGTLNLIR